MKYQIPNVLPGRHVQPTIKRAFSLVINIIGGKSLWFTAHATITAHQGPDHVQLTLLN